MHEKDRDKKSQDGNFVDGERKRSFAFFVDKVIVLAFFIGSSSIYKYILWNMDSLLLTLSHL